MIVTVCMNPAIDKTVEIEKLFAGGLNRIQKVEYDAGGKGINVSKTIHALGGESIATGFLGGMTGNTIEQLIKSKGIACDFVYVEGETRTNTKVIEQSGAVTELNEPGPWISEERLEQLVKKLEGYAGPETLFVLSGSVPKGVPEDIYRRIIECVHENGAKVLLDADGALFCQAVMSLPEMIKPNQEELKAYAGLPESATTDELKSIAENLVEKGIHRVAVSMGSEGAFFVKKGFFAESSALSVEAHSTVGAGDAMVAAMAYAWERQLSEEETVRLCMAASAGAVTTIGTKPPEKTLVEQLKKQVKIKGISS